MAERVRQVTKLSWLEARLKVRAARALERQLAYQKGKADELNGQEIGLMSSMLEASQRVRKLLETVKPINPNARVLEVGSGAHGLIFMFGDEFCVGVDPLAVEYARLFPDWQRDVSTLAAQGERLPFAGASFDIILCDNVIDHAEQPLEIISELVRVIVPNGVIYFTVNVHHPFYSVASDVYGFYKALGFPFEITPFADHTVHLTTESVQNTLAKLPLKIVHKRVEYVESGNIQMRHFGDNLKKLFFKNVLFEIIAVRQ